MFLARRVRGRRRGTRCGDERGAASGVSGAGAACVGRRAGGHLAHLLHRQRAAGREVLRRPARRLEQRLREALALLDERLADERDEQEEDGRRDAGHAHLDGGVGGEREDADGGAADDEDAASTVVENGLVSELRARVEQV